MPANPKKSKLPFGYKLVLNQWLIKQCGYDPLAIYKGDRRQLRPMDGLAEVLRDCQEGIDTDKFHHFYKVLKNKWPEQALVTLDDLLRYEQNIVRHTDVINEGRLHTPIVWKYYQWLSLLFAEIYLDRYFNQRDKLLSDLNAYIECVTDYWQSEKFDIDITLYTDDDLNKICLQNATGSGKTLLMHVNFMQFSHYAEDARIRSEVSRTLLITPNEGLSKQHAREMQASGIRSKRLILDGDDMYQTKVRGLQQVDYTEITKLSDEDGPNKIAVRNLGDQNLLLVDEAHRGMGSKEETGWFASRERLVERGFAFEYSATFKEAINAAKRPEIEAAYCKNILFDYSYHYFYEDGYGKDYRIFNLPKSYQQTRKTRTLYLTACLLSFYQQIKLHEDKTLEYKPYNLEKPLWVFVGKSVSTATGKLVSDVVLILQFIADVLNDAAGTTAMIDTILNQNAQDTGLLDGNGNDIFAGSFLYIKELMRHKSWTCDNLFRDILAKVFLSTAGGQLTLAKIKGNDSEIMLRAGIAEDPFGLINVGDTAALIKHIEHNQQSNPEEFSNFNVQDAEFSERTIFDKVHESTSQITVLLGSKKFVEGWDCWRVSTLGLMHVGQSEGAQIIQLFGRGVRLKGHDWSLMRSSFATPARQPKHIQYLETLNVFGVGADFMDKFKQFLEDEGLPSNDQKKVFNVPLHVTHDFGKKLKVLRPRIKDDDGNEYDFQRDAKTLTFGDIPEKIKPVEINWYPRIDSIDSKGDGDEGSINQDVFSREHLAFLDYQRLFFDLDNFRIERAFYNLNIRIEQIQPLLQKQDWYNLLVPAPYMALNDFSNVAAWQKLATELLKKYCIALCNHSKAAFIEPRLELRPLTSKDANIPNVDEYQLIVDSSEDALIEDIVSLKKDIEQNIQTAPKLLRAGGLKAFLSDTHLYKPVMCTESKKIQIAPVSLNVGEFVFVEDLHKHLQSAESDAEFYLLRNESRGRGIGFFEAGNFYPDFLLWKVKGDMQYIAFIEPHGLGREGYDSKKIQFYKTIKDIQQRLGDDKVCLNSFIVTQTRHHELEWGKSIEELAEMHVLFMVDSRDQYIPNIISRMEN